MPHEILLVGTDSGVLRQVGDAIHNLSRHCQLRHLSNVREALESAGRSVPNAIVFDVPLDGPAINFLSDYRTAHATAPVLLVSDDLEACSTLMSGDPGLRFLQKPITGADLQPAVISLLDPIGALTPHRIEAFLSGLSMMDIVQTILHSGATCHVGISAGDGTLGGIEVRNGEVFAVGFGNRKGPAALIEILRLTDAQVVQHGPHANIERNVFVKSEHLLIEAAHHLDESTPTVIGSETRPVDLHAIARHYPDTPKLLIVEDNDYLLDYLQLLLTQAFPDHLVMAVRSGSDGMACVRECQPKAIVLDRHLDDMEGEAFTASMRRASDFAETPVLVISGDIPNPAERIRLFPGPTRFLEKPFRAEEFVSVLREMLAQQTATASA